MQFTREMYYFNLTVLKLVNTGVGFAKNRAAALASGRFLCFCDADDISHPERLERSLRFIIFLSFLAVLFWSLFIVSEEAISF